MGKHRKMSSTSKKFAAIGVATVTASALTTAAVPVSKTDVAGVNRDVALSAAIDYTQLITDSSNSLDNILFIFGNVGGAASGAWNPIATMIPGGLLPTFTAGTTQNDLTTLAGILAALTNATNVGVVPGLPPDATALVLASVLSGVNPQLGGALGAIADTVLVPLDEITAVLDALNAIPGLDGVPLLEDLLDSLGLTATQTVFTSGYDWPILGLNGTTTIGNTFVQLPSLTAASLVTGILGGLNVGGLPLDPAVLALVNTALAPLDGLVSTPSVTAWIPAGSGTYNFPLGGSAGWLATMPTVAIGPLDGLVPDDVEAILASLGLSPEELAGIDLSGDTVIAIPLFAAGATAPLGLASFGIVTTPGITFPTATGVSTLGGTTLMSFNILGFGFTNLNTLASTYVGTNGVNHNSGTNVLTLTTPLGPIPIPIVFSLGSFNAGTTGFGFTGPSFFGVGLLPPFQVGDAPMQESPDGLIPAALLNAGLLVPTQLTDLTTLLGLPNPFDPLESVLNPAFDTAVAPFGSQITDALNSNIGPLTNGFASGTSQLTALLAQLTGGGPPSSASSPSSSLPLGSLLSQLGGLDLSGITGLAEGLLGNALGSGLQSQGLQPEPLTTTRFAPSNVASPTTGSGNTVQLTQQQVVASENPNPTPVEEDEPIATPKHRKGPLLNILTNDGNSATPTNTSTVGAGTGTNRPTPVKDAVTQAGDQLKKTLGGVTDGLKKALGGGDDENASDAGPETTP